MASNCDTYLFTEVHFFCVAILLLFCASLEENRFPAITALSDL